MMDKVVARSRPRLIWIVGSAMSSILLIAGAVAAASLSFDTRDDHCPGIAHRVLNGDGVAGQPACSGGEAHRVAVALVLALLGCIIGVAVAVVRHRTRPRSDRPGVRNASWRKGFIVIGRAAVIGVVLFLTTAVVL